MFLLFEALSLNFSSLISVDFSFEEITILGSENPIPYILIVTISLPATAFVKDNNKKSIGTTKPSKANFLSCFILVKRKTESQWFYFFNCRLAGSRLVCLFRLFYE